MRHWINLCENVDATKLFMDHWNEWAVANGSSEPYEDRPGILKWGFGDIDVNLSTDGKAVTLEYIVVERELRKKGRGTEVMAALCSCADQTSTRLKLIADESGSDSHHDDDDLHWLVGWYERFGFELTGNVSDYGFELERFPE